MIISKNCQNWIEIKFEIENVDFVRQKFWVENFESKILSDFKLNNWYVEVKCQIGWMDGKAGLQHSKNFVTELMDEWMAGWNKIKL